MLMISSLVQIKTHCLKSFLQLCRENLRCPWWVGLLTFWGCKSSKAWNIFKSIKILFWLVEKVQNREFGVYLCSRFQANPKESHLKVVKRILKYLKGTTNFCLWYPCDSNITLSDFSDSNYAGCKLNRKSTSDTCHLLGSSLISWNRKKQACVTLSTIEAEYGWNINFWTM